MNLQPNRCLQLAPAADGSVTVWIDSPGRSVNVFDAEMLSGLEMFVDHLSGNRDYRLVVFRSRKPDCFFAGADVTAIAGLTRADEVQAIIERGQRLMQRVSELNAITLAVIDGMCLGGGLEFALACSRRVATDSQQTKLGLPEIRLGLIPGWGGTQRLPRIVGLQTALKMILKGSSLNAARAKQAGLVDRVIACHAQDSELQQVCRELLSEAFTSRARRHGWRNWLIEANPLGRQLIQHLARKKIAPQAAHYPALAEAINAVSWAHRPSPQGFAVERDAFTRLIFTPTAQNLLSLFVARDRARKVATWLPAGADDVLHARPVPHQRLAVVGAGAMGAGIGALAAERGLEVVFKEVDDASAHAGEQRLAALLDKQVAAGRMTKAERQATLDRCAVTTRWDALGKCDFAIEAVLEIDAVKRDVFQQLDRWLPEQAPLVSNTSSLSITQMATATRRHARVAGLHFFNPVDRMELVEVVRTEMTNEASLRQLLELVRRLGKTPVVTSDKPGFLVNRVLFPYLGEAVRMVAEGFDIVTVDRELKQFGMPMGPLELLDQVGIDIASHVAASLAKIQDDAQVPAQFLRDMVDRRWLGKKSGLGFYRWEKKRHPNTDLQRATLMLGTVPEFEDDGLSSIQRRLVYPMLNEAVHCLDELVVSEAWMVDLGMVLGTGFAPHLGGPLRLIDSIGSSVVLHNMSLLERHCGQRFSAADGLRASAAQREPFFARGAVSKTSMWESSHEPRYTTES